MSVELIIVIVVVLLAVAIGARRKVRTVFSPRGGGVARAAGIAKEPVSLARSAGPEMQLVRHDAEPAALPGRRDGAVWPPAVDLRGVHKHFGSVQAVRGVTLAISSGEVMAFLVLDGALGRPRRST